LNILELFSLPLSIDIVISEEVLLKRRFDFWEHEDHFFELLLMEETNHSIDLWSNTGGSWLSSKKTDFAEEVATFECSDE
jgi:hypothetical protein